MGSILVSKFYSSMFLRHLLTMSATTESEFIEKDNFKLTTSSPIRDLFSEKTQRRNDFSFHRETAVLFKHLVKKKE